MPGTLVEVVLAANDMLASLLTPEPFKRHLNGSG